MIPGLFHLTRGEVPSPDGPIVQQVHHVGRVSVPSGLLVLVDSVALYRPLTVAVPPGEHPVTVATVTGPHGDRLTSYLTVHVAVAAEWAAYPATHQETYDPDDVALPGVAVDSGRLAVLDGDDFPHLAEARTRADDGGAAPWLDALVDVTDAGPLLIDGRPALVCPTGFGDGVYPVLQVRDPGGALLSVVVDLGVLGRPGEELADMPQRPFLALDPVRDVVPPTTASPRPRALYVLLGSAIVALLALHLALVLDAARGRWWFGALVVVPLALWAPARRLTGSDPAQAVSSWNSYALTLVASGILLGLGGLGGGPVGWVRGALLVLGGLLPALAAILVSTNERDDELLPQVAATGLPPVAAAVMLLAPAGPDYAAAVIPTLTAAVTAVVIFGQAMIGASSPRQL